MPGKLTAVAALPTYTPEDVLETALQKLRSGERVADKLLVVYLDTGNGDKYKVGYSANDMRCSEILALLTVATDTVLQDMK